MKTVYWRPLNTADKDMQFRCGKAIAFGKLRDGKVDLTWAYANQDLEAVNAAISTKHVLLPEKTTRRR